MPLTEGNTRIMCVAKQVAKGTPNTTPTHFFPLSGDAALNPNRQIIQLPETDLNSQRSNSVVVGASPGGGWQGWLRATHMGLLSEAIQGSVSGTLGTTLVAVPVKTLPYYTILDVIPGVQCTQYNDCRFGRLSVSSEAMGGTPYSVDVLALSATLGATEPGTITLPTDTEYSHSYLTTTVGGSAPGTHDSVELTINRNVIYLRGDMGLAIYDTWPGLYDVSGSFRRIYTSHDDYRKVHGGSAAATALTRTVFSETLALKYEESGTRSVEFVSSAIEYTSIAVPVNVDGTPILETLEFNTQRQSVWASNMTVNTKWS
jgi:hypothetical protein